MPQNAIFIEGSTSAVFLEFRIKSAIDINQLKKSLIKILEMSSDQLLVLLSFSKSGFEKLGAASPDGLKDFDSIVKSGAKQFDRMATPAKTGMVTSGVDFGSNKVSFLKSPKVAVLSGDNVSPYNFGAIWHFFEQQIAYEITVINTSYLSKIQLHKYNVIVLPTGYYDDILDKKMLNKLNTWVEVDRKEQIMLNKTQKIIILIAVGLFCSGGKKESSTTEEPNAPVTSSTE